MKKIFIISIICLLAISCEKEKENTFTVCDSNNPMEDYVWLKELKATLTNCSCEISIIQGTYNNETVFFIALTDALCDGIDMPSLYNCDGNIIKTFTVENYQDFYNNVSRDKVLYRCPKTD